MDYVPFASANPLRLLLQTRSLLVQARGACQSSAFTVLGFVKRPSPDNIPQI